MKLKYVLVQKALLIPLNCFIFISGISDVAKDSGIVVNPSRANESARIYAITKFVKKYVEDAKLGQKLVLFL